MSWIFHRGKKSKFHNFASVPTKIAGMSDSWRRHSGTTHSGIIIFSAPERQAALLHQCLVARFPRAFSSIGLPLFNGAAVDDGLNPTPATGMLANDQLLEEWSWVVGALLNCARQSLRLASAIPEDGWAQKFQPSVL